ncbi:MAG: alpha/beta hydrolase fold domain-containing protein [Archangium sp.]|nr:alpha/beta hydrolase fold domain-containing protein [Archangium sp.]
MRALQVISRLACVLLAAACGGPELQTPMAPFDAGQVTLVDAGTHDAGAPFDAGVVIDSGVEVDAGVPRPTEAELRAFAPMLDAYIDQRMTAPATATAQLIASLQSIHATAADVEALLKAGRASYPTPPQALGVVTQAVPVSCYSSSYSSVFHLSVPATYTSSTAWPLVVVGHGGNSGMTASEARSTALNYITQYRAAFGVQLNAIVVAPATERGWSPIGDALIFSTISKVSRDYHVDPDRIFVVGQSMGGHLAWRSAMTFTDRWAGVSPQSGGYDSYITNRSIENLYGLPGYGVWGSTEPFGLRDTNVALKAWLDAHRFPWSMVERTGGHSIYASEQLRVATMFQPLRRNIHAPRVYLRAGGAMKYTVNWDGMSDTIFTDRVHRWNRKFWLEVTPRPTSTDTLAVWGEVLAGNRIALTTDKVRQLRVYLHPDMGLDFSRPIRIEVNGDVKFDALPPPDDLVNLLETVREFDDRTRIARTFVDVSVTTDRAVAAPSYP